MEEDRHGVGRTGDLPEPGSLSVTLEAALDCPQGQESRSWWLPGETFQVIWVVPGFVQAGPPVPGELQALVLSVERSPR